MKPRGGSAAAAIVTAGLIAGALDITAAIVFFGPRVPARIHVVCVGLPIALAVRRFGPAPAPAASKEVSAPPAA